MSERVLAAALPFAGEPTVMSMTRITTLAACLAATALAACGSSGSGNGSIKTCGAATSGGGLLQPFTPPCTDQGSNAVLITASGEVLALGGYDFPPADPEVAFRDGWEVKYSKMLVTFDHVTLSRNPDKSPGDQSQVDALVAQEDGPWVVDLHKGGPVQGKGGSDEQAVPVTAFVNQNRNGNAGFDTTQRYAFGFDIVPAAASAKNVNLDATSGSSDLTDYQEMITKGYTALFVGTATFRGADGTGNAATCSSPAGSPAYDFTQLPKVVNFRLGFTSPTTYINCQNPDNDPASAFNGEEHERGVALRQNQTTIAQATFHTDHPFWDSFIHDTPAHFDQIAAQYVGVVSPTATIEDMATVKTFASGFTDKNGAPLPWRTCLPATYTPPDANAMHFDVQGRSVNTSTTVPGPYLRDYRDFMTFNESTFGHLNSDGLCFVKHNYPSAD
jgi:hypothetical protein